MKLLSIGKKLHFGTSSPGPTHPCHQLVMAVVTEMNIQCSLEYSVINDLHNVWPYELTTS